MSKWWNKSIMYIAAYYDPEYPMNDLLTSVIAKKEVLSAQSSSLERRRVVEILLTTVLLPTYAHRFHADRYRLFATTTRGSRIHPNGTRQWLRRFGFSEEWGDGVSRIEWETFFTSCQIHRVLLPASAMRNGVQR
jgi:hypothetical protein